MMEKRIKFKVYCRKETKEYDFNGTSTAEMFRQFLQSEFQIPVHDQKFVGLALNVCDQHEEFQFFLPKSRYVFMLSSEQDSNSNYNSCLSEYAALRYLLNIEENLPPEKIDTSFIKSLCLTDVILPPNGSFPKGEILILHFFKKDTDLTNIFYENIKTGHHGFNLDAVTIFGWDISIEETHRGILDAVHLFDLNNPDVERIIQQNQESLLYLTYDGTNFILVNILKGKHIDEEEFTRNFNFVSHIVDYICHEEPQQDRSASAIQQKMYEQFGHKDYDYYDSCDHDLLRRKLAFAFYGCPQNEITEGTELTDDMMFYTEKQRAWVEKAYKKIRTHNNKYSKCPDKIGMRIVYNYTESLDKDPNKNSMYPVFILRICLKVMDSIPNSENTRRSNNENLCVIVIDHTLRVYQSWDLYLEDNTLPECFMHLPRNGKYTGDLQTQKVQIQCVKSPKCGGGHKVLKVTDIASTVGSLGSGAMFGIAMIPSVTLAPFIIPVAATIAAGAGIYAIARSSFTIHDRRMHYENLSFSNSEARAAYLNIVAGSVGFVSLGATTALTQLAATGRSIPTIARGVVNGINVVNIGTSGVALGNSVVDVVCDSIIQGKLPSTLTIVQLSSSLLFFGNAVYNFRSANQIITDSQINVLRSLENSMKKNNLRETFKELQEETIRQKNGNVQAGREEVIATMRRIDDPSEVMAALGTSNHFNGIKVDVYQFAKMDHFKKTHYLTNFSKNRNSNCSPNTSAGSSTLSTINEIMVKLSIPMLKELGTLGDKMFNSSSSERIYCMINIFSPCIQHLIITVANGMIQKLRNHLNLGTLFQGIHSKAGVYVNVIQAILDYTETFIGHNATFRFVKRSVDLFEKVFRYINWGDQAVIADFAKFITNWTAKKLCEYWDHPKQKCNSNDIDSPNDPGRRKCSECSGYNYCRR